jgi:hypothetical protein
MKRGDLVKIINVPLRPGEPSLGIYWSDGVPIDERDCDCLIFWNDGIVPCYKIDLVLISEVS